ncbi:unnamed protein product [Cyprideis torosa]|uniref:Uncharacterized protein n=1 Tax=Cyprideis torosa TaxID=163714 RepID=A0A7R8WGZ2_9CRUS|nr:unnamed protein product [Cyprideis torosa]CAG0892640.1 unnamed protein product [Cyprideis torosa]
MKAHCSALVFEILGDGGNRGHQTPKANGNPPDSSDQTPPIRPKMKILNGFWNGFSSMVGQAFSDLGISTPPDEVSKDSDDIRGPSQFTHVGGANQTDSVKFAQASRPISDETRSGECHVEDGSPVSRRSLESASSFASAKTCVGNSFSDRSYGKRDFSSESEERGTSTESGPQKNSWTGSEASLPSLSSLPGVGGDEETQEIIDFMREFVESLFRYPSAISLETKSKFGKLVQSKFTRIRPHELHKLDGEETYPKGTRMVYPCESKATGNVPLALDLERI